MHWRITLIYNSGFLFAWIRVKIIARWIICEDIIKISSREAGVMSNEGNLFFRRGNHSWHHETSFSNNYVKSHFLPSFSNSNGFPSFEVPSHWFGETKMLTRWQWGIETMSSSYGSNLNNAKQWTYNHYFHNGKQNLETFLLVTELIPNSFIVPWKTKVTSKPNKWLSSRTASKRSPLFYF